MTIHLDFAPDPARARALDRRMHGELAASLRHVADRAARAKALDVTALARPIGMIERGERLPPQAFADYFRLVLALSDGDEAPARAALAALAAATPAPRERVFAPLRDPSGCERSAGYVRMFAEPGSDDIALGVPGAAQAQAFVARFERGIALMRAAFPELADEVDAIVHEVVAIASVPGRSTQMDGASHFQLWGALFLNADFHPTDAAMMEVIAHESAHSLLFGFCTEEPLVLNDDDERYPSPLRADLRPMDGIYHATFVSARMHLAMSRLLALPGLDDTTRTMAREARVADRRNFDSGLSVVERHGRLTRLGTELMAGARRYMTAA